MHQMPSGQPMTLPKWGQTSPFGLLRYAEEYRLAANTLCKANPNFTVPPYLLIGQSIELSLKAYVRTRPVPLEDFGRKKGLGHDLDALLDLAYKWRLDRIVELLPDEETTIREFSPPYRDHLFRYIKNGSLTLPKWEGIALAAEHLTKGLRTHCHRATLGAPQSKIALANRNGKF